MKHFAYFITFALLLFASCTKPDNALDGTSWRETESYYELTEFATLTFRNPTATWCEGGKETTYNYTVVGKQAILVNPANGWAELACYFEHSVMYVVNLRNNRYIGTFKQDF